jgi:hypothetical protein
MRQSVYYSQLASCAMVVACSTNFVGTSCVTVVTTSSTFVCQQQRQQ